MTRSRQDDTARRVPEEPGDIVSMDIMGPFPMGGMSCGQYILVIVDHFSGYADVEILLHKDAFSVLQQFQKFYRWLATQARCKVKILRTDGGNEFCNLQMEEWLKVKGIIHERTAPYSPASNGRVERQNRTIIEAAKTNLMASGLPQHFWMWAVYWTVFTQNRSLVGTHTNVTPYEAIFRHKPDISKLEPFGAPCFAFNEKKEGKLDSNAIRGNLIGYQNDGIYQIVVGKKIITTRNVKFLTTTPEEWLSYDDFEIDEMDDIFELNEEFFDEPPGFERKHDTNNVPAEIIHSNGDINDIHALIEHSDPPLDNQNTEKLPIVDPTDEVTTEQQEISQSLSNIDSGRNFDDVEEHRDNPQDNVQQSNNQIAVDISNVAPNLDAGNSTTDFEDAVSDCEEEVVVRPAAHGNIEKEKDQKVRPKRFRSDDEPAEDTLRRSKRPNLFRGPFACLAAMISGEGGEDCQEMAYCALTAANNLEMHDDEPKYHVAIKSSDADFWKLAINAELDNLRNMKVYTAVDRPANRKIVKCRFVLKRKRDSQGQISKYKARLVACGYSQQEGIDYHETFAPVARLNTIFILLSIAANRGWHVHQMDVDCAYLNAPLKEEIFMEAPVELGLGREKVLRLNKALYGLKQAGREWHEMLSSALQSIGWKKCILDPCLFTSTYNGKNAHLLVYVDDILVVGEDHSTVEWAKASVLSQFSAKDQGEAHYILGMEIIRNAKTNTIHLRQRALIDRYIDSHTISPKRRVATPLPNKYRPIANTEEPNEERTRNFQKGIGELLYLSRCTRPDISAAVNILSRFMSNPSIEHQEMLERIFIYLSSTRNLTLRLGGNEVNRFVTYTDSDWAEDRIGRKSTGGYIIMFGKGPIAWRSFSQKTVAKSTCEAEYVALCEGIRELIWARQMLEHFGAKPSVKIFSDSEPAIESFKNPTNVERLKHVDINFHFIRDFAKSQGLEVNYIPSKDNLADIFTKPLDKGRHHNLRQSIGILSDGLTALEKGSVEIPSANPSHNTK